MCGLHSKPATDLAYNSVSQYALFMVPNSGHLEQAMINICMSYFCSRVDTTNLKSRYANEGINLLVIIKQQCCQIAQTYCPTNNRMKNQLTNQVNTRPVDSIFCVLS